ncbi:lysine biosynthesis protein LysW [Sphaerisporangium sp. NPDC051017]|uniref:lysine biosynthesis protein LysW n=1 Tax=unclassified Sphaerisporangium TaxID=2630420 RepID=UPI00340DAFF6
MIACPECEATVDLPDAPRLNEILECGDCHAELEILSLEPTLVGLAPEVEEDWGE